MIGATAAVSVVGLLTVVGGIVAAVDIGFCGAVATGVVAGFAAVVAEGVTTGIGGGTGTGFTVGGSPGFCVGLAELVPNGFVGFVVTAFGVVGGTLIDGLEVSLEVVAAGGECVFAPVGGAFKSGIAVGCPAVAG